jgi:transcriptional regulator
MYLPEIFREDDPAILHEIMTRHRFATLVTVHEGAPFATHLPFIIEGELLFGHVARANPQWRDLNEDRDVLVIFQGPHAYVSPSWYRELLHVPTWNYVTVHAYGRARLLSSDELRTLLERLIEVHEAPRAVPWRMSVLPDDFVHELLQEIVGFAIRVERLEGKLKLSQNRDPNDRVRVLHALHEDSAPAARATAAWMKRLYGIRDEKTE